MSARNGNPLVVLGLSIVVAAGIGCGASGAAAGQDPGAGVDVQSPGEDPGEAEEASEEAGDRENLEGEDAQVPGMDPGAGGTDEGGASDLGGGTDEGSSPADPGTTPDDPGLVQDPGPVDTGVDVASLPKFSFFVTSLKAMRKLSGSQDGFGGDLRFGETGPGAGLRGADKICATIAEASLPGAGAKPWRAFLSATADENGQVVNAIDRIGNGPWYDRLGRLLAPSKADLMSERPQNGSAIIRDDFPNEDGVPNHRPDPTLPAVDNHDFLTGTNSQGKLYGTTATCKDWTVATGATSEGKPRVGHSWPRTGGPGFPVQAPPGGGDGSMAHWMSSLDESGCKAGINLVDTGGPIASAHTVGSGGGYGGIYCFSLVP